MFFSNSEFFHNKMILRPSKWFQMTILALLCQKCWHSGQKMVKIGQILHISIGGSSFKLFVGFFWYTSICHCCFLPKHWDLWMNKKVAFFPTVYTWSFWKSINPANFHRMTFQWKEGCKYQTNFHFLCYLHCPHWSRIKPFRSEKVQKLKSFYRKMALISFVEDFLEHKKLIFLIA